MSSWTGYDLKSSDAVLHFHRKKVQLFSTVSLFFSPPHWPIFEDFLSTLRLNRYCSDLRQPCNSEGVLLKPQVVIAAAFILCVGHRRY